MAEELMKTYLVKEIFDTLQGEGGRAGARSIFVRLGGCNLWNGQPQDRDKGVGACAQWCDTDFVGGDRMDADAIVEHVRALWPAGGPAGDRWVVLSGGEPGLQVDEALVRALKVEGLKIAIETNGTVSLPAQLDWICVSPKLGTLSSLKIRVGSELKVVLPGAAVGGWTWQQLEKLQEQSLFQNYFVQPQDPIDKAFVNLSHLSGIYALAESTAYTVNLSSCVEFVKAHPDWRVSLQTHKLMGVA